MNTSSIVPAACLVVGFLVWSTPVTAQTFTFDRSFPATRSTHLEVTTERGKIRVRAGGIDAVVVVGRVSVRRGWNTPANAVELARATADTPPIEHTGDAVRLRIPSDDLLRRAVTIAYEVEVPVGMRVVTRSQSGETRVEGVRGAVSVWTQSGAIKLEELGETRVETGSGAVSVDRAGPLRVRTSSSRIDATRIGGDVYVRTESGRVTVLFVDEGDLDVRTDSSAITIDGLDGGLAALTKSGHVRVSGIPRRPWEVVTGSSAIDAKFAADAAFTVDATSDSGSVKTEPFIVQGETEQRRASGSVAGGGPLVHFMTRSGSITLTSAGH